MIAVRDEQTALVSKLLEQRADPTVKSFARTDSRQEHFAWVGSLEQALQPPDFLVSSEAISNRPPADSSSLLNEVDLYIGR